MTYRDLVVLYPSHGLEDFPADLPDEKAAGLLNAFAVAWHPALLASAQVLPREQRADSPPVGEPGRLILVPPACDELLPTDWLEEARAAGATVVTGLWERDALLQAVLAPLAQASSGAGLLLPPSDLVADFLALGTCRLQVELLTRRMHHFDPMDENRLLREAVEGGQAAVAGRLDDARAALRNCFEVLTEARERFYPVECYLLDLCLLIPRLADEHLVRALEGNKPLNVLVAASDLDDIIHHHPEMKDRFQQAWDDERIDLIGGEYRERPVPLLPLTSFLREYELGQCSFLRQLGRLPNTWGRRRYGFSTLVPQILQRSGCQGAMHVAMDDGIYPDAEQSRIRWEGADGSTVEACTRIPLAAEGAASFLRFASRMAESMQQDQTAAILFARWPEVRCPFWEDFERIHAYSSVLGRFVTFRRFFEQTDDPGRLSRFQESEYLSPFLIQAVAAEERDPIDRFRRHFQRRARFDSGRILHSLACILGAQPLESAAVDQLEQRLEESGPDLPKAEDTSNLDAEIESFTNSAAARLGAFMAPASVGRLGYLVLNPLSFSRTVVVETPRLEVAPANQAAIRGAQFDQRHRHVVVELPPCGYAWISGDSAGATVPKKATILAEGSMIRNEFIEVYLNEATGGIARIKQYGRHPNRLSQQLAFRFPRERVIANSGQGEDQFEERTFYSQMRCTSFRVTSTGPALGEIVSAGRLIDPEDGSQVAEFEQTVRVWRGRPMIELDIDLRPSRLPEGDPWSNYIASRFAWNDGTATLTRSVLGQAHAFQWERFESPHFFEIATESQRTTLLFGGLTFHRKTGPRMLDSLLITGGETARRFHFDIAIDADYPMQPAMDVLVKPVVLEAPGPPAAGPSGWLFHVDAKNVQILQILPLFSGWQKSGAPADSAATSHPGPFGFRVRLVETEGRHRAIELRCFRTPIEARQCDLRGETLATLRIENDAVLLEMTGYEIVDVELRFEDTGR